ncbi:serine hydrolase domain-containing protein [Streptomyces sp. NPDC048442]|uniref:serine hydrolase domain-containing protein n=1 Tax=Streptomyces sp. NPDC048442 TaxID=3154823 RepID=UPI0034474018
MNTRPRPRTRTVPRIATAGIALAALACCVSTPSALAAPAVPTAPTTLVVAQGDRTSAPDSTAPDSTAPDSAALRALLARLPDDVSDGALVRMGTAGHPGAWAGSAGPVTPGAQLPVGSVTKIFTNALVLRLAAEHRIAIDAPVRTYLPALIPTAYAEVTVRQLMDHTSDLPHAAGGPADPQSVVRASFAADEAAHPGRTPAPGTAQQYNGLNSFVAGLLVERTTGRSYGDALQRHILRPLGLRHTRMSTDPSAAWYWAEGGLVSTAADLDRFMTALLRGRLLPPAQQRHLYEVPAVPNAQENTCLSATACFSAGGLMRFDAAGTTVWGKTGSGPGWASGMFATRHAERRMVYAHNPSATATRKQQIARVVEFVNAGFPAR